MFTENYNFGKLQLSFYNESKNNLKNAFCEYFAKNLYYGKTVSIIKFIA